MRFRSSALGTGQGPRKKDVTHRAKREKPGRSKGGGRVRNMSRSLRVGRGVSNVGLGGKSENERYGISYFNKNKYSVANESLTLWLARRKLETHGERTDNRKDYKLCNRDKLRLEIFL